MDKVREEFELAISQTLSGRMMLAAGRNESGNYANPLLNENWLGFQLGRASLAREVPVGSMRIAASLLGSNHWDDDVEQAEAFLATVEELRK